MIALSKLTATAITSTAGVSASIAEPKTFSNTQSGKWGWRKMMGSKTAITFKSSAGGLVTLPISELWALAEAHDSKLVVPPPAVAPAKAASGTTAS